jgi:hypothetical protein
MTRGMFFRVLATLGFGQASAVGKFSPENCVEVDDNGRVWNHVPCQKQSHKKGEELCPLGHNQKPRKEMFPIVSENGGTITIHEDTIPAATMYGERVHICSECGMIYVPQKGK